MFSCFSIKAASLSMLNFRGGFCAKNSKPHLKQKYRHSFGTESRRTAFFTMLLPESIKSLSLGKTSDKI